MDYTAVIEFLREERQRRELSLQQVSNRTGISRAKISHWELGRHLPAPPDVERWAAGLGFTVRLEVVPEDAPPTLGDLALALKDLPDELQAQVLEYARALALAEDELDRSLLVNIPRQVIQAAKKRAGIAVGQETA